MGSRLRGNDGIGASSLKTVIPAQAGTYAELDSTANLGWSESLSKK